MSVFSFFKRGDETPGPEEHSIRALLRILELNKDMARTAQPEALPDRILDAAIELVGAERGFLIERSAERPVTDETGADEVGAENSAPTQSAASTDTFNENAWEVVAARNFDGENVRKALLKFSKSITGRVLKSGAVFRSDDAINDEMVDPSKSMTELRLRSVLCVPMHSGESISGCVYLDNRFAHGQFDEAAAEILEAFADQAGLALERVRLLARNSEVQARLGRANDALKAALKDQSTALDALAPSGEAKDFEVPELQHEYPHLTGRGRAMLRVLGVMDRVTAGDFPVLLLGESGTGKELVGRSLHENGPRAQGPFMAVNCGAIAEGLLESELFGVVKGAYTGAVKDRVGLFEAAEGGVLFLDEIGEMSLALQAKLLRVLQEKCIRRVGGNEERPIDVRIISATNRDLALEVANGRFREDLYYRLIVVQIEVPPLRERREDIPALVETFLAAHAEDGSPRAVVDPDAMELLLQHDWPGNVRELENEITRMIALGGQQLGPDLLAHLGSRSIVSLAGRSGVQSLVGRKLGDVEAELIRATLEATGGKRGDAARMLGIPRRTFYNRLKALGIDKG